MAEIKAFRSTGDTGDKAIAKISFSDHAAHTLDATAGNFLPGKVLPLGTVQYIKPSARFPDIRLCFTPAKASSMARAISALRSIRTVPGRARRQDCQRARHL